MNSISQVTEKGLDYPVSINNPLVSIITPVYNGEKYLEDLLQSVMKQNYQKFEHIVIDDGSTDNTAKILQNYDTKYNLKWFSKGNEGQTISLNKSLDLIKGEIVLWINADDVFFDENVIKNVVEYFTKNDCVSVIYGHMAIIDPTNMLIKIQYAPPQLDFETLLRGHYAACIGYRTNILKKFRFDPRYDFVMDYEQSLRMAKNGIKFGCVNKIILGYRKHPDTKSIAKKFQQQKELNSLLCFYEKNNYRYSKIKKIFDSLIIEFFNISGIMIILEIKFIPKILHLASPIKTNPSIIKAIINQIIPFKQI